MGYLWPMGRDTVLSLEHAFNNLRSLHIAMNMGDDVNLEMNANGPQSSPEGLSSSQPSHDAAESPTKDVIPRLLEGARELRNLSVSFPPPRTGPMAKQFLGGLHREESLALSPQTLPPRRQHRYTLSAERYQTEWQ
jgi:hypothetical protein